MRTMNDFLKIKNKFIKDGFTPEEVIKIFEDAHLKYLKIISDAELGSKQMQEMQMERFYCFCIIMSMKSEVKENRIYLKEEQYHFDGFAA